MLAVEMLPAGHGDALVVEYGPDDAPRQLLIDAGTYHAWNGVRAELVKRHQDRYEVFVVSHIDEDHIGGAIALLDDRDLKYRFNHIWFNGFVHCQEGGNVLGPINGEQLTRRIATGGFAWNHRDFTGAAPRVVGDPIVVPAEGDLPCVPLPGGATLVLVSPTPKALQRLAGVWERVVRRAGLVPGTGAPGHTTSPPPRPRHVPPPPDPLDWTAIECLAAQRGSDSSEANASSIAFILEYDHKRVLFGADAVSSILTAGLRRYGRRVNETRPRIDLVKLAHHGSNANISMEMLGLIDCRRFLISTNADTFGHPNDGALAKIILTSGGPVTFFCNYENERLAPWAERGPGAGARFAFPQQEQGTLRVEV